MKKSAKRFDQDFSLKEMEFVKKPDRKDMDKGMKGVDPNLMNAGMYMATPILIGLFIGYLLDRKFHTSPTLLLIFLLAGTASSFYNLYKLIRNR